MSQANRAPKLERDGATRVLYGAYRVLNRLTEPSVDRNRAFRCFSVLE
jgi:hypothetical protein